MKGRVDTEVDLQEVCEVVYCHMSIEKRTREVTKVVTRRDEVSRDRIVVN